MLNHALELAQEWGKDWLRPIQGRLAIAYPQLVQTDLDYFNEVAQAAMKFGHDLAYSMAGSLNDDAAKVHWKASYLARFPWAEDGNMRHLMSTGMYYAWKDGIAG